MYSIEKTHRKSQAKEIKQTQSIQCRKYIYILGFPLEFIGDWMSICGNNPKVNHVLIMYVSAVNTGQRNPLKVSLKQDRNRNGQN